MLRTVSDAYFRACSFKKGPSEKASCQNAKEYEWSTENDESAWVQLHISHCDKACQPTG
jgi:hypothetical protein